MMLAAWRQFVAPDKFGAVQSAARGELPLGFGRQFLARPFRIGFGILEGDMDHGVVAPAS